MPRPFAYNPQTSPGDIIPGTIQYQDLAIGVDEQDYSAQPGGVVWWMGPDESNYIIAGPVPAGNHPTPVGPIGTVRFVKTMNNSPEAFLMSVWQLSETHFPTVVQGYQWLVDNGFWTTFEPDRINIYASGDFTILANPLRSVGVRLNSAGVLDTTFNIRDGFEKMLPSYYTGFDTLDNFEGVGISSIVELDNGSLLYFGNEVMGYNGIHYGCVVCLNKSGGIDFSFSGGFTAGETSGLAQVNYAKKLSDGKILAVGRFGTYGGDFIFGIAKFNQDGSRDLTWNDPEIQGEIYSFVELDNGKIVVVGAIRQLSGDKKGVIQLNANGTVDTDFGLGITALFVFIGGDPRVVVPVAGGKLIIAGTFTSVHSISNSAGIIRLNSNGTVDTSWNTNGGFTGGFFARQPFAGIDGGDGVILIAENELAFSAFNSQTINSPVVKINYADKSLDDTFSNNISTALSGFGFGPRFITPTLDGTKFLIGGMTSLPLTRLNLDGTKDVTFNSGTGFDKKLVYAQEISDTKIYTCTVEPARYNTQAINKFGLVDGKGARNLGFDANGFVGGYAKEQVRAADGDIIAVGTFTQYNGQTRNGIAKFEIDGTITNYANHSGATVGGNTPSSISDAALQSNGQLVIVGPFEQFNFNTRLGMARVTSSGTIDFGFYSYSAGTNVNNRFSTGSTFSQVASHPTCIKIKSNDKILVGGAFTNWNNQIDQFKFIMQFNADGSRDTGWTYPSFLSGAVLDIETQSDGKVIAVGAFQSYGISTVNRIIRYGTNGVRDTAFNSGGAGFNNNASKIFVLSDDSMFVSGAFTTYNGVSANRIVKLTANGAIDTSFVYGTGFNGVVEDIVLTSEDELIMAGAFTTYNGVAVDNRMIRLSLTGEIIEDFEVQSATNGTVYSILYRDPFE
jgi:uncharacterized delta-60 repeat protein